MVSALDWGSRGREFKSPQPDWIFWVFGNCLRTIGPNNCAIPWRRLTTERARKVLDTVRFGYDKYGANPPSGQDWVLHWAASVSLLRTVGHALRIVDAKQSPAHRQAIDEAWEVWRAGKGELEIFWLFIQEERHAILKEFELHAGRWVTVHLGGAPTEYTYPFMGHEEFAGKTQPEMVRDAIHWWETQLTRIEASIASSLAR